MKPERLAVLRAQPSRTWSEVEEMRTLGLSDEEALALHHKEAKSMGARIRAETAQGKGKGC